MSKSKIICFIYVEANGLHDTNEDVIKKNLYSFARLVALNYEIGYTEENIFISIKKIRSIIKPRCMYIEEETIKNHGITMIEANDKGLDIEKVLDTFIKDLTDVSILISHDVNFNLKTIMGELVRYNKPLSFNNYTIIDTQSFFHDLSLPELDILYTNLIAKKKIKISNLEKIRLCFLKLYNNYELSLNK